MRGSRWFTLAVLAAGSFVAVLLVVLASDGSGDHVGQLASDAGFLVSSLFASVACAAAARRSGGPLRRSWLLLAGTAACWFAGNVWWFYYQFFAAAQPYPSMSDAFYLAALPLAATALLCFPTPRGRRSLRVRTLLDGLIVAGSVLFISTALVLRDLLAAATGSWLAKSVFLTYPLADIVLVTLAILLIVRTRSRPPLYLMLLAVGLISYAVADTAYAALVARGSFSVGTLADLGWICGYLLVGLAALSSSAVAPSQPELVAPVSVRSSVLGSVMVYVPLIAALVAGALADLEPRDAILLATAAPLIVLFGVRQALQAHDTATLRQELEDRVATRTRELNQLARQSERILRSVAEGIYGVDPDGRLTFVNPAAARMLGCRPEELVGRLAASVLRPGAEPNPTRSEAPDPAEGGTEAAASTFEDIYLHRTGSTFPVEVTSGPIAVGDEVIGRVVAFRDITERRQVERIKNEFISVISHELRTPLTSIRGSLGLLAGGAVGELPSSAQRMISIAVDNSERLTRLINDILDIERLESGAMPMEFAPHDAAGIVTATLESLRPVADAARVRLAAGTIEGRVHADADRIGQTLTNLVGNAIKFSPPDTTIRVSAVPQGDVVEFAVADQGRGIPPDMLQRVFDRFRQVDSSDSRTKGGTGLGLAISHGIVQRHGGRIWAESAPGRGTCFRFTLPAVPAAPPAPPDDQDRGQPTVLVCDDDPDLLVVIAGLLTRRGYRPVPVRDAAEVVHRAQQEHPDVILLDLRMPGTTGWEAVEELRSTPGTEDVPIIVMSGLSPVDDPELSVRTDGWVTKPVDERAMSRAVGAAIRGHGRRRRVLLVEDDEDLSRVLVAVFERHGIDAVRASTRQAAIALSEDLLPDALVLDLYLPDGDGFSVVEALRQNGRLATVPLIVYSAREIDGASRERLRLGRTLFFTKGRVPIEDLERHVLDLIGLLAGTEAGEADAETASAGRR